MSKHTPGPWKVQWTKKESGKVDLILVGKGEDYTTAFVPCFGDNAELNASLIAAAPDLFEALKFLFDKVESGQCEITVSGIALLWYQKARDAIAKAEGRNDST